MNMQSDAGIDYDHWDMGGDMWDTLHPFETGYDQMADLWFTGLMDILLQASAGPDQGMNEFDNVTMDASGSIDPQNGNLSYQWVQTAGALRCIVRPSDGPAYFCCTRCRDRWRNIDFQGDGDR